MANQNRYDFEIKVAAVLLNTYQMEIKDFNSAVAKMHEKFSICKSQEIEYINHAKDSKLIQEHVRAQFWYINRCFALYHLCVEQDYAKARQRFYLAGRIGEYICNVYDSPWQAHGVFYMFYALLSDHQGLIERYARLTHPEKHAFNKNAGVFTTVLQNIIADDWNQLEGHLHTMRNFKSTILKRVKKERDRYIEYCEAIMQRDMPRLQRAIMSFEAPAFKAAMKRSEILYEDLISHHTLGLAKLAWYKGLPVEIDSRYVPKAMLSVAPLAHYEERYHFLEGGQGIAGHLEE